jgi:hypothetical protein
MDRNTLARRRDAARMPTSAEKADHGNDAACHDNKRWHGVEAGGKRPPPDTSNL